jgi:hypothetical protein
MPADRPPPTIPATTLAPRSRPSLLVRAAGCTSAAILVLVFAYMVYWLTAGAGRHFHSPLPPLPLAAWTTVWTLGAAALLLTRVGVLAASLPRWLVRVGPWLLTVFFAAFALLRLLLPGDGPSGDWQIDLQGPLLLLLAGLCIIVASEEPAEHETVMTQHDKPGWFARWREHRRAKRQEALESEHSQDERLNPTTRAYTDADNYVRRWTSFLRGGGGW